MFSFNKPIPVAARASRLSQAQVKEVFSALPSLSYTPHFVESHGDLDQTRSLRTLGKCDFFTKEIDEKLLTGICRIAVHSAKDLPETLPEGLTIIALTEGLTSIDVLVLRENETLEGLPSGAKIATSSVRREEAVTKMRSDLTFIDLRGTIEKRLHLLETKEADGVVVAEAALIRLGLHSINRVVIPGETVEGQGRLAIVARCGDHEMEALFAPLDARAPLQ